MKTKIVLFTCISVLFSCASKPIITDTIVVNKDEVAVSTEVVKVDVAPANSIMVMLTRELYESKILYENSCGKCHKLYAPTDYKKSEWPSILYSMQSNAELNDNQITGLLNYINSQI
jgi:cytochrome c5